MFRRDPATGETRLADLYQSHPMRILFPRQARGDPPTAVLTTVSGGIAGGDRIDTSVTAEAGASVFCLAQAAEKIYRAVDETPARMTLTLRAKTDSRLEYLPQETILFDRARLRRETVVDLSDPTARVLAGEIAVLGRGAMGERVTGALFEERWRIDIEGRPVWRDAFRLSPGMAESPFGLNGATALASIACVAPAPSALRDCVRETLEEFPQVDAGATAIGPQLLVRFLGRDPAALRRAFMTVWARLRAEALDRPARLPPLIHC